MGEGTSYDVGIVGGGACGLSVLIQVIEKTSEKLRMAIFEKNGVVGPGLAYSEACRGARINTHAGSMGLSASNPGDFLRWMNENPSDDCGGGNYPFRSFYGQYIKSEMTRIIELARTKGIELHVYSTEVLDVEQQDDGWIIQTADDSSFHATKVVLAMGNHIRQLNKHLNDKPLYFDRPWPSSRLLDIPKSASVAILGSRLTAIDEALFLVQRGHTGPIYLLSRSCQLPKVQGGSKKYERAYTLYNLARELEDSPDFAVLKIARHIHDEVESISNDNVELEADGSQDDSLVAQFRCDVEMAQKDEVPIFRVLTETGPMSERYWNCLGSMSKKTFLDKYMSTWISYRAAMPLVTGEKLLRLLENGQVRVMRSDSGTSISHQDGDGPGFNIPVKSAEGSSIKVDALVEATGMEFDISKIETPLMRNLLSRKLLSSHVAGGVDVNFRTLRAQKDLYCLGSLTRGVHFHTTTLDRSVVHAEWVADDIVGLPPRKFLHIALFVGNDVFSQLLVSQLVPRLLGAGHVPFVYVSKPDSSSAKRRPSFEMRERQFYETSLFQDTVVPHVESVSSKPGSCLTLRQLQQRYGILVQDVPDFNDPDFVTELDLNHIDLGYCIRCPQALGADIVQALKQRQGIYALQGSKSRRKSVEKKPVSRAKAQGQPHARFNLKELHQNPESATTCTAIPTHTINYSQAIHGSTSTIWDPVVETMFQHAEEIGRGRSPSTTHTPDISTRPCPIQRSRTTPDMSNTRFPKPQQGLRLSDKEGIKKILLEAFASPESDSTEALKKAIEEACRVHREKTITQGVRAILKREQDLTTTVAVKEDVVEPVVNVPVRMLERV